MKSVGDIKHADDADSADFSFNLNHNDNLNGNDNLNRRPTTHNLQPYDITSLPRKTAATELAVFQYITKGHLSPCGGWPFYW